jgi:hypothetical protein
VLFHHIPNFCLQYDQILSVLRLEWVAHSDHRQLRASAEELLSLLRSLEVRHLLLDMNSVPNLPFADQLWLGDHWMPALVALPLERLVLIISSSQIHNQLAIDALHDLVKPAIRFESQYFSDMESALDWTTDSSPRLAALGAEWAARYAATS